MTECRLLTLPVVLALYGLALLVNVLDRKTKAAGRWLGILSAFLAACAAAAGLLLGVPLQETAAELCVFLLLDLGVAG